MPTHVMRSFDEELRYLVTQIAAMGGHAERMVGEAMAALVNGDKGLAQKVVADDGYLDAREREIGDKAVILIARRQPVAADLREVIGAIRIAGDLERVGDLGKNIAKRAAAVIDARQPVRLFRGLEALSEQALIQLNDVLDAYATRQADKLAALRARDEEIDATYTSIFRELLTYMMEDARNITACTHLLFCAKNLERIGDHATNIAETVYHIVTGELMSADRPKEDKSHRVTAAAPSAGRG